MIYCYHLSCGRVVACAGVYDKTVIENGIFSYCKLFKYMKNFSCYKMIFEDTLYIVKLNGSKYVQGDPIKVVWYV